MTSEKLKILDLIVSVDPTHGGPITTVRKLSEIWRAQGHVFDIVSSDSPDAPYITGSDLSITALGKKGDPNRAPGPYRFHERYGYSSKLVPYLRKVVAEYDAVLVHGLWNYSTIAARRVLPGGSIPYFMFPHGGLDPWHKDAFPKKELVKRISWKLIEGVLAKNAAAVFFTTEMERELSRDRYLPYQLNGLVAGYGCAGPADESELQRQAFGELLPEVRDRQFLLFLSRIHPKKGCELLVEAFADFAVKNPGVDLVMAGPDQIGWRSELTEIARVKGVDRRIHWTGMLTGAAKWGAYRSATAFILPSRGENFGIVVAEALACGTPVLISDKVNLWREVSQTDAGLVQTDSLEGTKKLIENFFQLDGARIHEMGQNARSCYDSNFRIEAAAQKIIENIRSFLPAR